MQARPRRAHLGGAVLLGGALLLGLLLVGAGVANWDSVRTASALLTRGQAELIHEALRAAMARRMPTAEELKTLLGSDFEDDGLSYIAIVSMQGEVQVDAGVTTMPPIGPRPYMGTTPETVVRVGDHARAIYRRGARPRIRRIWGEAGAATQLVFEFVPREAIALEAQARRGIYLAALAALGALVLTALYVRQRRLADEALAKEEQSRRLAALGQMSAVLAHELRNPLASLKGHAQLLERALPEGEAPRAKAERVVGEAVRLELLVNDLLAFVRTGALDRKPEELSSLVRAIVDDRGAGRASFASQGELTIAVDRERLRQVIVNLVDNAVQAGDGAIEVALQRREGGVELSVRDHGPGIAEADLPRLFEPFYTTRTQGTGLGLAISRQIVELHGGTIAASNAVDGGARFVVILPERGG